MSYYGNPPSNYYGDNQYGGPPQSNYYGDDRYGAPQGGGYGSCDDPHAARPGQGCYATGGGNYRGGSHGGYDVGCGGADYSNDIYSKPTFNIFCKSDPYFSLAVKYDTVILTPTNSSDADQHWYKDDKYGGDRMDEEGFPSFALVNKGTNMALKGGNGAMEPVRLVPYNPNTYDDDLLWSHSQGFDDGYRAIRIVKNIRLNLDALNGDQNSGGVQDGTKAVMWEWNGGDNQLWKIMGHC